MDGLTISRRTVPRHLAVLGLNHRRFIDPDGENSRKPQQIVAKRPGHMIRIDVKKVGRIPDGGGRRTHGKNSDRARQVARRKGKSERGGYVYLHSAIDGYSRPRLHRGPGRHQRITPYTPRHNGKVERHNRDPLRGVPLRPYLDLRGPTPRSPWRVERPLQLPPATQRRRRRTTSVTAADRRK